MSGSLRKVSYNRILLQALSELAPEKIHLVIFPDQADLPLFNPDLEDDFIPVVTALKSELARADGLILASPEYAHGISAVMKNTLEWLVSGNEFINVPIALMNTSPRASHAQLALREVVKTMSGKIIEPACLAVPLLGSNLDVEGILANPLLVDLLSGGLDTFYDAIEASLILQNRF